MDRLWILVNIGCIECGVSSNIVGVFDSEDYAHELKDMLLLHHDWREGGQNDYEVFPMPEINSVSEEYAEVRERFTD